MDVCVTHSPGMRPLTAGASLQISRTPILDETERPEKRKEEEEEIPNPQIPEPPSETPAEPEIPVQQTDYDASAYWMNPYFQTPMTAEAASAQYFQHMMMFQQLMYSQHGWQQQQQHHNNGGGRKHGRGSKKRRRNRNRGKNKSKENEKNKATASSKLNKDAAVFTPEADFKDPAVKADPTKEEPVEKVAESEEKTSQPPKSAARTWANMVGKLSSEKKPVIKVDKSRSPTKPRVHPSQPPVTKPTSAVAESPASPSNPAPGPIAPPHRQPLQHPACAVGNPVVSPTNNAKPVPARLPHPATTPQGATPQARPPLSIAPNNITTQQQQPTTSRLHKTRPIQRPPVSTTNATPTSATAAAPTTSEQPQRPTKPRPVWPKIKPSSNKITTTIIPKGDRDSSSSEDMNPDTGSNGSKERDASLASDLDEMSDANPMSDANQMPHAQVKTLDMPMELLTTNVAQPQMWAQLASHTQIWAGKSKQAPKQALKQGDPRSCKEKRVKKRNKW